MLKVVKFLSICLVCVISISCVKKTEAPKPNYGVYTPPISLADYCYFKTGSYWVYQDSVSLKLDSVYVQNAYIQTYEIKASDGKDYTGIFHHYFMKTIDGYGDEREYDIYDENAAQTEKCCGGRYFCEVHWNRPPTLTLPGTYFGYYVQMFNNFSYGVTGGHGIYNNQGDECWSRGYLNSLVVNSKTYNDVVSFEILKPGDSHVKNYISKYIGVIKRIDLDSNKTWILKNYNIN